MFDFYHVQINQGNVLKRFKDHLSYIGHVQIASVQDRAEPDKVELDFSSFPTIKGANLRTKIAKINKTARKITTIVKF